MCQLWALKFNNTILKKHKQTFQYEVFPAFPAFLYFLLLMVHSKYDQSIAKLHTGVFKKKNKKKTN